MQHDFILLDRSGSMGDRWAEAIGSVNTYVQKLAEEKVDTGVTLAVFDGQAGLDFLVVRDRITPGTWKPVTVTEVEPRGMTPLNDAIGRIVALAKAGNYDKLALIIMTDGHENVSRELTVKQAKDLLNECRAKNWQVIFLGADFDNKAQATSFNTMSAQTVASASANLGATMRSMGSKRASYGVSGQSIGFSDEEKQEAWKKN